MQGTPETSTPPARSETAAGGLRFSGPAPETLKKRRDFLACARALKQVVPGMIVQARRRMPPDEAPPRVGYTCSKKVGKAVERNRAKRRLREAARALVPAEGKPGWDYVLIGRADVTARRPFEALVGDLASALARLHAPRRTGRPAPGRGGAPAPDAEGSP